MEEDRRDATWLDAVLDRHLEDSARMADALVELDRHPGHRLLSATAPTGRTGRCWAVAAPALEHLWHDLDTYRDALRRACDVRDRRARPGPLEVHELHALLVEPSIEVGRHPTARPDRGLSPDRVETTTLDGLTLRMRDAHQALSALVVRCDELSRAASSGLAPLAERVHRARDDVAELGLGPTEPVVAALGACADRLAELEAAAGSDPLVFDEEPPDAALTTLAARVGDVADRLGRMRATADDADGTSPDIRSVRASRVRGED